MLGSLGLLLDTSIVLYATRADSPVPGAIDARFGLSTSRFLPAICEVSVAELLAFSSSWGEKRKELLRAQIKKTLVIPIAQPGVQEKWAEVKLGVAICRSDHRPERHLDSRNHDRRRDDAADD